MKIDAEDWLFHRAQIDASQQQDTVTGITRQLQGLLAVACGVAAAAIGLVLSVVVVIVVLGRLPTAPLDTLAVAALIYLTTLVTVAIPAGIAVGLHAPVRPALHAVVVAAAIFLLVPRFLAIQGFPHGWEVVGLLVQAALMSAASTMSWRWRTTHERVSRIVSDPARSAAAARARRHVALAISLALVFAGSAALWTQSWLDEHPLTDDYLARLAPVASRVEGCIKRTGLALSEANSSGLKSCVCPPAGESIGAYCFVGDGFVAFGPQVLPPGVFRGRDPSYPRLGFAYVPSGPPITVTPEFDRNFGSFGPSSAPRAHGWYQVGFCPGCD